MMANQRNIDSIPSTTAVRNHTALVISTVVACCILDLLSACLVFIKQTRNDNIIHDEIYSFSFVHSTFDILLLTLLRFIILIGACVGVLVKKPGVIQRLHTHRRTTVYFGCFQNIYVVIKILITARESEFIQNKIWSMSGITVVSTVLFYICWRFLESCKEYKIKLEVDDYAHYRLLRDNDSINMVNLVTNSENVKKDKQTHVRTTMMKLLKLGKQDIRPMLLCFLFLILFCSCETILPYLIGLSIKHILIDRSKENFIETFVYLTLFTLLAAFTSGLQKGLFSYLSGKYTLRLQSKLFSNILQFEMECFDSHEIEDITSTLTTDCTKIKEGLDSKLNALLMKIFKSAIMLIFMMNLSWKLSIIILVMLPMHLIMCHLLEEHHSKVVQRIETSLTEANASAEEVLSSMKTVRSFAAEGNESTRYDGLLYTMNQLYRKEGILKGCCFCVQEMSCFLMVLMVLFYSGHLLLLNQISISTMISFLIFSFQLTFDMYHITSVYTGLIDVVHVCEKVFAYMDRKSSKTMGTFIQLSGIKGNIQFKKVSFSYPSTTDNTGLKNFSLNVKQGEVVAIVGPKDAGKSSIINLLQCFYEPGKGIIFVDGVAINSYDHKFLREKVRAVTKEPVLFNRTIAENISYGLQGEVTKEEIECAARLANIDFFISSMPDAYETVIGKKGVLLSPGHKQRIALARALVRNPAVLLLHEITTSLNFESASLVQHSINDNLLGRTVIAVTHHLNTLQKADKVIVMKNGEIIAVGRHNELIDKCSLYYSIVKQQLNTSQGNGKKYISNKDSRNDTNSSNPTFRLL